MDGFENILFLVFVVVSAAISWFQKSRQKDTEVTWEDLSPPSTTEPPQETFTRSSPNAQGQPESAKPVSKGISWEEELRKLLTGESEAASTPQPTPPPRVVPEEERSPVRFPAKQPPRIPAPSASNQPGSVREASQWIREVSENRTSSAARSAQAMNLTEARREADRLKRQAEARLQKLQTQSRKARKADPRGRLIRNLKNPHSARDAFLASVVFSSPVGMGDSSPRGF